MNNLAKLLSLAIIGSGLMNSVSPSRFDLNKPETGDQNINYNYKYTGLVNNGKAGMPLVGQLSKDAKSIYYITMDAKGAKALYKISRTKVGVDFSNPVKLLGAINDTLHDISMVTLSADENTMVVINSTTGNLTDEHLYIATKNTNGQYGNIRKLDEINNPNISECYPWLSPDGLTLYFSRREGTSVYFWVANRKSLNDKFGNMHQLNYLAPKISSNLSCLLTNNELEIYSLAGSTIYHASRKSQSENFGPAEEIAKTTNNGFINGITMTDDAKELFVFNSVGYHNSQILRFYNTAADEVKENPGK